MIAIPCGNAKKLKANSGFRSGLNVWTAVSISKTNLLITSTVSGSVMIACLLTM